MLRNYTGAALIACCMTTAAAANDGVAAGRGHSAAPTDYRLHGSNAEPPGAALVDAPGSPLRTGFGGALVSLYPSRTSGFHIAAGGRLFGRAAQARGADPESNRLLLMPRGSAVGLGRGGRRRPSPAMLVGLDRTVAKGLTFGMDGGAALGRLYNSADRLGRLQGARGDSTSPGRLNQMGRVTLSYLF